MKYYLKLSVIPFLYLFFQSTISIAIFGLKSQVFGLILLALNALIFVFTICVFSFKNGESAYKVLLLNDAERRIIVETGTDRPINVKEEYSPFKGAILGIFPLIPLLVLMLVHLIIYLCGSDYSGIGAICAFLYKMPFAFFEYLGYKITSTTCFLTLLSVPVVFFPIYISYNMGARRARLMHEKFEEQKKYLHGENK